MTQDNQPQITLKPYDPNGRMTLKELKTFCIVYDATYIMDTKRQCAAIYDPCGVMCNIIWIK